jgi:hypothetical protein
VFVGLSAEGAGAGGYSGAVPECGDEGAVCGLSAARTGGVIAIGCQGQGIGTRGRQQIPPSPRRALPGSGLRSE